MLGDTRDSTKYRRCHVATPITFFGDSFCSHPCRMTSAILGGCGSRSSRRAAGAGPTTRYTSPQLHAAAPI